MSKIRTFKNIKNIITQSFRWRNSNLSDENQSDISFTLFSKLNIVLLIISLIISLFITKIEETTINAVLTFTSIFATLIIPVIIMVYDKFNSPETKYSSVEQKSKYVKKRKLIYKNFVNRFVFTTLENVIIAIMIIIFIILYKSLLVDFFDVNLFSFSFEETITKKGFFNFCKLFSIFSLKSLFLFLFLKFIFFIFYSMGALGDFFKDALDD